MATLPSFPQSWPNRRIFPAEAPIFLQTLGRHELAKTVPFALLKDCPFCPSETEGALTTRPVTFRGKYLFVNIDDPQGELRVEVLDRDCRATRPFTSDNCVPVRADRTLHAVHWKGANDLANVAGKQVKLRFHLKNGRIYAFWISSKETGASHGYVAAGGPGFTGPTDTVGSAG